MISEAASRIRKNMTLLVPPILTQVIVPLTLLAVAALTLFPLLMGLGLTGDVWGFFQAVAGGALVLAIVGFLVDTYVTAGWAYMNRCVVVNRQTGFADLWVGANKYFLRILGGRILVGVIVVIPIAIGMAAFTMSILSVDFGQLTQPEQLDPATIMSLMGPILMRLIGVLLIIGVIELVLYFFLLPWMQALVMDDLSITASIKSSFVFVRRNLATMIGYMVISGIAWIVGSLIASLLWPSVPYAELMRPTVYMNGARLLGLLLGATNIVASVVSALLSAFFTLLLFLIYADRTHTAPSIPSTEISTLSPAARIRESKMPPPRPTPAGVRYCVNCGTPIIALAVFCPNCGARQPPLELP